MVVKGWPGMMTGPWSWTDWQANNGDWIRCGKVGRRGREVKGGGGDGLESIVINTDDGWVPVASFEESNNGGQ